MQHATTTIRVADLDDWIKTELQADEPIAVRGGFRRSKSHSAPTIEICELDGIKADTIYVTIPQDAPIQKHNPDTASFSDRSMKWWNTWASILAATGVIPPVVDPIRLFDLLNERRRIRFCCDTNALCNGVAAWLLFILDGRADIFTSAVVDRELSAWPDHFKDFWNPRVLDLWLRRTHFRLARRLIETPPDGVVIDRLSPEQGALMFAKLRDESGYKSPDADILLIELARELTRDQPRNARVVYLTGDRNNARAATNALGAQNVLYAVADGNRVKKIVSQGAKLSRGWWAPNGPLGTLLTPELSRFLWDLLAACDFLVLESDCGSWRFSPYNSFDTGIPSDWEDPWLEITQLRGAIPTTVAPSSVADIPGDDSISVDTSVSVAVISPNIAINPVMPSDIADEAGIPTKASPLEANKWLLHPVNPLPLLKAPLGYRPTPKIIFSILDKVLSATEDFVLENFNSELQEEARKILVLLGAIDEKGRSGKNLPEFRTAWMRNDLEWFHGEFKQLPGYLNVVEQLQSESNSVLSHRAGVVLGMVRALGQAARVGTAESGYIVGDAPLAVVDMQNALDHWLPQVDDTLTTNELCILAAKELHLTPYRFEIAMQAFWSLMPDTPFQGRTGGTVVPGPSENIVVLGDAGFRFQPVAPGALTFGRDGPVRFISRITA